MNKFKTVNSISDIQPFVKDKEEIRFFTNQEGITVGCYMFMDSHTFDIPEALECRGIAFDQSSAVVSRPLHKFFNIGEKTWLFPEELTKRDDIAAIYEKIDGSMIATALINGELRWRSKKSFDSDVVKLCHELLPNAKNIVEFSTKVAQLGLTAIFEFQHPLARIVVEAPTPTLTLIHVRDNLTGEYVLLNKKHTIHQLIKDHKITTVRRFEGTSLQEILDTLPNMKNREGYVIQFSNGDMAKIKCPWYIRLHRSITMLRERDIATLALNQELDDTKSTLVEAGISLDSVEIVEAKLRDKLTAILKEIDNSYEKNKHLDRKNFAITNNGHPYFGLLMQRYLGVEISLSEWYRKNRLKEEFSLKSLLSPAQSEAAEI